MLPDLSRLSTESKRIERDDVEIEGKNKRDKKEVWAPRAPTYAQECDLSQNADTRMLLETIQDKMIKDSLSFLRSSGCSPFRHTEGFKQSVAKLLELVNNESNFERQGCGKLIGAEFHQRMDLSKLRELVLLYNKSWSESEPEKLPNGAWNLDDAQMSQIIRSVMYHKDAFLPMIRALIDSGYVSADHQEFELFYRFQPIRHANAGVYHMDDGKFYTYADDGEIIKKWTENGSRAVTTSACINMSDDPGAPEFWHDCGTTVALGVPVLKSSAMDELMHTIDEEAQTLSGCITKEAQSIRNKVARSLQQSTELALIDFQKKGNHLKNAGVDEITLDNGVISDYNDSMFHKSSTIFPENYSRVFFVLSGKRTKATLYTTVNDSERNTSYMLFVASI